MNALQRMNDMRFICNHGTHFTERQNPAFGGKMDRRSCQEWSDEEELEGSVSLLPPLLADVTVEKPSLCKLCSRSAFAHSSSPPLSPASSLGSAIHNVLTNASKHAKQDTRTYEIAYFLTVDFQSYLLTTRGDTLYLRDDK